MKLKILIVPVLIVVIVVLAIWYVYPGWQDLNSKKGTLASAQSKLTDIQDKNSRAASLARSLQGENERRNILLNYIPEQEKEEDVIATLNALSGAAGLSVYNISVAPVNAPLATTTVAPDAATTPPAVTPGGIAAVPIINQADRDKAALMAAQSIVTTFKVTLGVAGNYGKIKDVLNKISTLARFNSIAALKIVKVAPTDSNADDSKNDNLKVDMDLNFNYLDKRDAVVNPDNVVFAASSFDMSIADNIKNKLNMAINNPTVDASGVPNPFVK